MADKQPVTNFKTVLNDIEYHQLIKGSDLWQSKTYQKNAETMRKRAKVIGDGLEAYYKAFESDKMKRDDKAKRIEEFFPLMDVKERSDFRSFAKWFPQIETWVMENYPKGYNIHNIVMGYNTFKNKEYKPITRLFNDAYAHGNDLHGNPSTINYDQDKTTVLIDGQGNEVDLGTGFVSKDVEHLKTFENKSKKKPVVMADVKRKQGVVIVTSKMTVKDFGEVSNKYFANATILFNDDKFTSDEDVKILVNIVGQMKSFIELTSTTVNMELKKAA